MSKGYKSSQRNRITSLTKNFNRSFLFSLFPYINIYPNDSFFLSFLLIVLLHIYMWCASRIKINEREIVDHSMLLSLHHFLYLSNIVSFIQYNDYQLLLFFFHQLFPFVRLHHKDIPYQCRLRNMIFKLLETKIYNLWYKIKEQLWSNPFSRNPMRSCQARLTLVVVQVFYWKYTRK